MNDALKSQLKQVPGLMPVIRGLRRGVRDMNRWIWRRPFTTRHRVHRYLQGTKNPRLHLGCGPHLHPGWLNTDYDFPAPDCVFMDASRPFPLPAARFEAVFTEHMIEHLTWEQGQNLLRESFRVLKPGGRIRVATPNLRNLLDLDTDNPNAVQREYLEWCRTNFFPHAPRAAIGFLLNNFMHNWGHLFIYDPMTLEHAMTTAGFEGIRRQEIGQSERVEFRNLENHGRQIGETLNHFETLVLEGRKPGPETERAA